MPIYLEWAPTGIIDKEKASKTKIANNIKKYNNKDNKTHSNNESNNNKNETHGKKKNINNNHEIDDGEDFSTLFIKNLKFSTDDDILRYHIEGLGLLGLRAVSVTKKVTEDKVIALGFGFAGEIRYNC